MTTQKPSSTSKPGKLFWILLLGSPGVFNLAYKKTNHWWQALGILIIYGLVVVLFSFPTKVWEKFSDLLADLVAEHLIQWFLHSGFHKKYREHIIQRNRYFDVKGLSTPGTLTLELEHVFVHLKLSLRQRLKSSLDIIPKIDENLKKGQSIWRYLTSQKLKDRHLVIIGPLGSGKTALIQHMTLTLAAGRKARKELGAPPSIPIVLYLRDHVKTIDTDEQLTLTQALRNHLKAWELDIPPKWFRRHLERGRCLVMLDGLDEVADPDKRKKVVAWVQRQMESYPRCRFIVTSRPYGYYKHRLNGVAVLEISPFSQAQIKRFVHNWYLSNEIMSKQLDDTGVRLDAKKGADDLIDRLNNSDLAELAVNPLLLSLISTVHRYTSSLPKRRVELYKEICEVFLGQRRAARDLELELTPAQSQRVLQPLAYHLMRTQKLEIETQSAIEVITEALKRVNPCKEEEKFLKDVERESGLLLERENGVLGFAHKTFQEYLTSVHILEQGYQDILATQVDNDWWHETIRLYSAQTDATAILAACLQGDPPSIPALALAIECNEEALELSPEVRIHLDQVIARGVEDPNEDRRRVITEALLALRLRRMTRVDNDKFIDSRLITHAEYQLFLDEMRLEGKYFRPDHWEKPYFPEGKGGQPVFGVRPSDAVAFCNWLTERENSDWRFRLPTTSEAELPLRGDLADMEVSGFLTNVGSGFDCILQTGQLPRLSVSMFVSQIAIDLARVNDLERALDLAHDQALHRPLAHDPDFSRILTRDLDHDQALHRALAHDPDFSRILARDLECALDLVLDLVLDLALHRDLALDRARDLALDRDLFSNLDRNLDLSRILTHDLALTLTLALVRDLDHALHCAQDLDLARTLDLDFGRESHQMNFLNWNIRIAACLISAETYLFLIQLQDSKSLAQRLIGDRKQQQLENSLERYARKLLDIYVDFAILEVRKRGELPAFEGIRIVRDAYRLEV